MIGLLAAALIAGNTTCTPGTKDFGAPYVAYDNAWLEKAQCVRFNSPDSITITSNAVPLAGTVVAYPSIRYGEFWTFRDAASGLPRKVTDLLHMTLHVASKGRAAGAWQSDADIYFHPSPASIVHHHATYELVISNRSAWRRPGGSNPVVKVGGVKYRWVRPWITCQRTADAGKCDPRIPPWQITVFFRVHSKAAVRIGVPAFTWFLIHHGALPRSDWLSSAAYGTECWSGGKGLTDSLVVTGLAIPRLSPGGGK